MNNPLRLKLEQFARFDAGGRRQLDEIVSGRALAQHVLLRREGRRIGSEPGARSCLSRAE
ncbi:MAG: hypothetical protein AVDCRST_MAG23-720 [uncultured Sphingosinicella sp.]|uniref:Uncharacterized protein n=1 Tax=uncultured Sphingosinicella sp. TaxID=478748 RepID=A0A6J4TMS9_9SPHN|nr:hypothetical protein [uncultured Sphingosinicella sp.]CAA9527658.1 MAG: hypothetical protein AVDCRST_MAG23-720 [uncultured Sphingosinicella sp.]